MQLVLGQGGFGLGPADCALITIYISTFLAWVNAIKNDLS